MITPEAFLGDIGRANVTRAQINFDVVGSGLGEVVVGFAVKLDAEVEPDRKSVHFLAVKYLGCDCGMETFDCERSNKVSVRLTDVHLRPEYFERNIEHQSST